MTCRNGGRGRVCALETLEPRVLLSGGTLTPIHKLNPDIKFEVEKYGGPIVVNEAFLSNFVPSLSSKPGSAKRLWLDFNGDATTNWGPNDAFEVETAGQPGTPAYDTDGDPTKFSAQERREIEYIWKHVAEKYSPFDVNVTTVPPAGEVLNDGETFKVVIGGDGDWYDEDAGGVAYVGGFFNNLPNIGFVFADDFTDLRDIGEAAAHEGGHGFGLEHQSQRTTLPDGTPAVWEYSPGTGTGVGSMAPIMGFSYDAYRGLWWNGQVWTGEFNEADGEPIFTAQDDLAILDNTLGRRADDHSNTFGGATPMDGTIFGFEGKGIIERTTDADYFSFYSAGVSVDIRLQVAETGWMLDGWFEVRSATNQLIATARPPAVGASLTITLPQGEHLIAVRSEGNYGDLGQYTITVDPSSPYQYVEPQPILVNPMFGGGSGGGDGSGGGGRLELTRVAYAGKTGVSYASLDGMSKGVSYAWMDGTSASLGKQSPSWLKPVRFDVGLVLSKW